MHVNQLVIVYSSGLVVLVVIVNIYIVWVYTPEVYTEIGLDPLDH